MASTPKRLHGPAQVSGAAATKYTVPALTKTVVRHIHAQNPSSAEVSLTMSIGADAAAVRILDAFGIPAHSTFDHFCYYVLDVGEVLQALAGSAGVLVLTINGDERTL